MIDCTITGISQEMDFEQGVTLTYLSVRLPNGRLVRAAIDDDTATAVVELQVKNKGTPKPVMRAPAVSRSEERPHEPSPEGDDYTEPPGGGFTLAAPKDDLLPARDGETVYLFGGQDSPDAPPGPVPATVEERNVAAAMVGTDSEDTGSPAVMVDAPPAQNNKLKRRSNVQRLPNGKVIVPSRTVPRNDHGYPVVSNAGANPEDLVGGRDRDEDGVGSI
jgi:hypothetical protein